MRQPYTVHTQCIHSASILTISLHEIGRERSVSNTYVGRVGGGLRGKGKGVRCKNRQKVGEPHASTWPLRTAPLSLRPMTRASPHRDGVALEYALEAR